MTRPLQAFAVALKQRAGECTDPMERRILRNIARAADAADCSIADEEAPRGRRLEESWRPGPELLSWATDHHPEIDHEAETVKFIDYWSSKSGRAAAKRDWPAAWRNWIRKADEYRASGASRRAGQTDPVWDALQQDP